LTERFLTVNVVRSAVPALGITRLERATLNQVHQLGVYPTADRGVIPRMRYAAVFHSVSNQGAYRGETDTGAVYATASVIDPKRSTTRAGTSTPFGPVRRGSGADEAEDPGRKLTLDAHLKAAVNARITLEILR
jgi:hypothetical protein